VFRLVWFFLAIQLACVPKGLCRDRDSSPYSIISGSCSLLARISTAISRNCSRAASRSSAILRRACQGGQIVGVSRLLSLSGLIAVRSLIHLFKPNPNALSSNALSHVAIHLKQLHREFYCVLSAPVQRFSSARS
jgi:hypothetical protein